MPSRCNKPLILRHFSANFPRREVGANFLRIFSYLSGIIYHNHNRFPLKKYLTSLILALSAIVAMAQDYPDLYLRGTINGWTAPGLYIRSGALTVIK